MRRKQTDNTLHMYFVCYNINDRKKNFYSIRIRVDLLNCNNSFLTNLTNISMAIISDRIKM